MFIRKLLIRLLPVALLLSLTACVTTPQGASLNDPVPSGANTGQSVWLKPVMILDRHAGIKNLADAQNALTASIASYARGSQRFGKVRLLPGELQTSDHVLEFSFSNYRLQRQPHPAYFPAAILTATLYIWFNGPIYNDKADVGGTLRVYDSSGALLAAFNEQHQSKQSVGFFSGNYLFPDGATPRTLVVERLLDQYQAFFIQQNR